MRCRSEDARVIVCVSVAHNDVSLQPDPQWISTSRASVSGWWPLWGVPFQFVPTVAQRVVHTLRPEVALGLCVVFHRSCVLVVVYSISVVWLVFEKISRASKLETPGYTPVLAYSPYPPCVVLV